VLTQGFRLGSSFNAITITPRTTIYAVGVARATGAVFLVIAIANLLRVRAGVWFVGFVLVAPTAQYAI
jgi:hypothetical protein